MLRSPEAGFLLIESDLAIDPGEEELGIFCWHNSRFIGYQIDWTGVGEPDGLVKTFKAAGSDPTAVGKFGLHIQLDFLWVRSRLDTLNYAAVRYDLQPIERYRSQGVDLN